MRTLILLAALLFGLAAPASAANDVATAQGIITSQVEALGRDDGPNAYYFAAPAIKNMFKAPEVFLAMGQRN